MGLPYRCRVWYTEAKDEKWRIENGEWKKMEEILADFFDYICNLWIL